MALENIISNPAFIVLNERATFFKFLVRWRGSIWKILMWDLIVFLMLYYTVGLSYKYWIIRHAVAKKNLLDFVSYLEQIASIMPMTFLLGFFVSTVLGRWWSFCSQFPWLTHISVLIQSCIRTKHDKYEDIEYNIKQAFCRYLNLAWILNMKNISYQIRGRFKVPPPEGWSMKDKLCGEAAEPTTRQVLNAINNDPVIKETYGQLVTEEEIEFFEKMDKSGRGNALESWIPIRWCTELTAKAAELGCLYDQRSYNHMIDAINSVRGSLGTMSNTYKFNIPLVYTQAIIIIVYAYYFSEIFSHQFIKDQSKNPDENQSANQISNFELFLPFVSLIRFILFMGWFKIGLSLINPLREDQSHFPTSDILDYNLKFMSRFTLTRSEILPPSMQLSGQNLKDALQKDAKEILAGATVTHEIGDALARQFHNI